MDPCYQEKVCNCKRDCACDEGYECCSEDSKSPTMGLCVKKDTCNNKTGMCSSKSPLSKAIKGIFYVKSKENYGREKCDAKRVILFAMLISLAVIIILRLSMK